MTREQAKPHVLSQNPTFLKLAKTKGYICPRCNSGAGVKGTGITRIPNDTHYKCFACGLNEDVFGLWAIHNKTAEGSAETFDQVYRYYGLTIDNNTQEGYAIGWNDEIGVGSAHRATQSHTEPQNNETGVNMPPKQKNATAPLKTAENGTQDFTQYLTTCKANYSKCDYLKKRGISDQVAERFNIGYDCDFNPPNLIIPTSTQGYTKRAVQGDTRYYNAKGAKIELFNAEALKTGATVFVDEGTINALSIIQAGGEAVSLNSASNAHMLIAHLEKTKEKPCLLLRMDNDKAGDEARATLEAGLTRLGLLFLTADICQGCNDPNEALQADKETFFKAVEGAKAEMAYLLDKDEREARDAYLSTSNGIYLQSFVNGIKDSVNTPCIPTGFTTLDIALDGGLYEGLYCIGAISSLGKTTFMMQMADQVAQEAGHDVLIFSLEMAKSELMAKSISRHTIQLVQTDGRWSTSHAKDARGITDGKRHNRYCKAEKELIYKAIETYSEYAGHIYVSEGIGDIGVRQIRETVDRHTKYTGRKPVVIVDYLQILAPYNDRATDKQNTDKAVSELKRISRDYKIPVIGISSFNRANYSVAVGMEAFKESGAIEYSSDVLIGLQLEGAGTKDFDATEAKSQDPRSIELAILKNRSGAIPKNKLCFDYYPKFNYFKESQGGIIPRTASKSKKTKKA